MTYYFDPRIDYRTFKIVCDKFPDTSGGPSPVHIDQVLWRGLRNRDFNVGIEDSDDPIFISRKPIPKNAMIIKNR